MCVIGKLGIANQVGTRGQECKNGCKSAGILRVGTMCRGRPDNPQDKLPGAGSGRVSGKCRVSVVRWRGNRHSTLFRPCSAACAASLLLCGQTRGLLGCHCLFSKHERKFSWNLKTSGTGPGPDRELSCKTAVYVQSVNKRGWEWGPSRSYRLPGWA